MSQRIISVSALVHYLKGKLDSDALIQKIMVQGEISNFTNHRSGHWYFTLKDQNSRISCVMFQGYAKQCSFIPKDGDKVILTANTSLFEASGQLQLYGIKMQLDGLGELYLQFEKLKKKLSSEGLFDISRKKMIPSYPMKIGLITGKNTAAREDVVSTLKRRWPIAEVKEFYTLVQGDGAPDEIIDALQEADQSKLDVLLLVRGGGSIEDLWAFNSEELARVICTLETPLITGVGHEVDVTIVDYVSDLRAPTPTGAAEMAVPLLDDVLNLISKDKQQLNQAVKSKIDSSKIKLDYLKSSRVLSQPEVLLENSWMQLELLDLQLKKSIYKLDNQQHDFEQLKNRMSSILIEKCHDLEIEIKDKETILKNQVNSVLEASKSAFYKKVALLDAYSPLKSLTRGYSLGYYKGELLSSVEQIQNDEQFELRLSDGKIKAQVLEREKDYEQ